MRLLPLLFGACCNVCIASASGSRSRLRSGHTPWASVRALLGSSRTSPAPAPAVQAPSPALPSTHFVPPASVLPPPVPSSSTHFDAQLPLASQGGVAGQMPMPLWAEQQASAAMLNAAVMGAGPAAVASPAAAAPPAAAVASGPGGNACYACLPKEQRPLNKDLQDVAAEQAEQDVAAAAHEAAQDSEAALHAEGKKNLRSVQASNEAAVDQASGHLQASAEAQQAGMQQDSKAQMNAAEHEAHVASEFSKFLTSEGIKQEGAKTSAKYIADAQAILKDLVKDIHKAGKEMSKELKTSASVGTVATNETEKYVQRAEKDQLYAETFMDVPLAEVHKAQVDANSTEDHVRTEAIATKFSTQAVDHGLQEAKKAQDEATEANQTSKFIFSKVMKTKKGIEDVTFEVQEALVKAENAHIEAQAAEFQSGKLLKNAP